MGRVLALDVGDKRIGLAISDPLGIVASPLETYTRKEINADIDHILSIVKAQQADTIVCGLPKRLDNTETGQTEKVRKFVSSLQERTQVKIVYVDERLTTVEAERVLIESNMRREKRKENIDKVAASFILQNYLQFKK